MGLSVTNLNGIFCFFFFNFFFKDSLSPLIRGLVKEILKKKKTEYSVKDSNGKTYDRIMSNLKDEMVISAQIWCLMSFCNTSNEGTVIYPFF